MKILLTAFGDEERCTIPLKKLNKNLPEWDLNLISNPLHHETLAAAGFGGRFDPIHHRRKSRQNPRFAGIQPG
ncbi:hypothetical protein Hanom_Chr09g00853891 [Helianthus anomalus]|nr:hypothetical protein HanPSC8_Chr03g0101551 [Helianthus annuus]